ncbi:4-coumarate--CoA ligase-like 7 [Mycena sanguinolenta]|uniref:4-coumarate--CoA ligase-like 7 n=1 Tax=Mycena sanguinolenta TaxID=230812 RepID=A0A8H7CX53_9AGAR|nr:4-coumarate--CoA ligase-like 7 [Mycena sanguinolenta]
MAPRIYTSHIPDVPIEQMSVFTKLFASHAPGDVGGHPGSWTAYVDAASGAALTRAQVKNLALSFAYGLRDHPTTQPSAKRGDTVLIFSPNSLVWPIVLYGSIAAGLRCTLANSAYTSHELAYQYKDSRAKLVFTAEEGISTVRAMFAELGLSKAEAEKRIVVLGNDLRWAGGPAVSRSLDAAGLLPWEDLLSRGVLEKEEPFEGAAAQETAYLCYSSGTTGNPKGVETTHQNITSVANLLQYPFYLGVTVVIQTRFEPVQFCANIERYKIGFAFIVPPVLVVLARHPAVDSYDLSSLEYMLSGAAPLGADLVKNGNPKFLVPPPNRELGSLCLITQGYGLTETSPSSHMLDFFSCNRKVGSVGFLLPNLKARLVEDDDGAIDAEEGKPGELWMQGPTVMKGYLNNPTATNNAITPDRWFKTGDIAIRDKEGYYYIVDRKKELIKYKGFQVPPAELEAVLLTHPEIADAAVIGVESIEQATELPRAYVVHADPAKVKTAEAKAAFAASVVKWMETKVAKHKFLRGGVAVSEMIPKSAAGKILRRHLRDQAKAEAARGEINTGFKARM